MTIHRNRGHENKKKSLLICYGKARVSAEDIIFVTKEGDE